MPDEPMHLVERPWEDLEELADRGDATSLEAYVDTLSPPDAARAMAHLDEDAQSRVLETLEPEAAADLLEDLPFAQAADLIENLDPTVAAAILRELPSDAQADLVTAMDDDDAEAVLAAMGPVEARGIRDLARYDDDVAGGLMVTEFLAFRDDRTVADVIDDLRRNADAYADYDVQYAYVAGAGGRLVGVLRLRDLLLARPGRPIRDLMIREPTTVRTDATLDELEDVFDTRAFVALPVVDPEGRLVGVIRRALVEEAVGERAESDYRKAQGIVGGEELRTMGLALRARRRLSWLSINIVLNLIAASVIAAFETTLSAVIALAFFLPIISDMSGCSGSQAVAVSIRELTLGVVRPQDLFFVWVKEIGVGVINGIVLGIIIGVIAMFWRGNGWLGLVVGVALAVNTMVAVSIGGLIPLVLKRFGLDPALASGPVLTTITDICGFFLVLGIATLLLSRLIGA
ncbi:MAG: magnesium transporter [Phycisphaerales bacterium]|nr:magnesium transporter [Phycisphaerales bacterium]